MADNSKDKQQAQLVGYQQAQNQLLAIQAQQRQNLAAAKADNNQSAARAQVAKQASGLFMANQQAQTANLNAQTRGILKQYGLNKPQTTRSQQKVGQNVIINNNTTNNYGGPVQGRALNFSDPQIAMKKQAEETGRFKAWLNGLFTKQSEEDAARNRAYEKRERELEKTSRGVTKKMGEIGKNLMSSLSPKRIMSSMSDGIKKLLFIFGMHLLASNWTKILDTVANIENKIRDGLDYLGFGENSGGVSKSPMMQNLRELIGGPDAVSGRNKNKSLIMLFKEMLIGDGENDEKSLWGHIKLYLSHKAEEKTEAMKQLKLDINEDDFKNMPGLITKLVGYLGDVASILVSGADGLKKNVAHNINAKAAQSSKAYQEMFGIDYRENVLDGDDGMISRYATDWQGNKVDLTKTDVVKGGVSSATMSVAKGIYTGQHGANINKLTNDIYNTTDAQLGQGAELARQLGEAGQGKISTAGVLRSFDQLNKVSTNATVENGIGTVLPSYLFDVALASKKDEIFNLANAGGKINLKEEEYKYIAVPKDEWDKAEDGESVAWAFANAYLKGVGGNALPLGETWKELGLMDIGIYATGRILYEFGKVGAQVRFVADKAIEEGVKHGVGKKGQEELAKRAIQKFSKEYGEKAGMNLLKKGIAKLGAKCAAKVAAGAVAGTAVPGWGNVVGAVVGALACTIDLAVFLWDIADAWPALAAVKAKVKDWWNDCDYRLKLVPKTYQLKEGEFDIGQTEKVYVTNKSGIKAMSDVITGSDIASSRKFDMGNRSVVKSMESALTGIANKAGAKIDYRDMESSVAFEGIDKVKAMEEANDAERAQAWKNNNFGRAWDGTVGNMLNKLGLDNDKSYIEYSTSYKAEGSGNQRYVIRDSKRNVLNVTVASEYAKTNMKKFSWYQSNPNPRKINNPAFSSVYGVGACAAGVRMILHAGGLKEGVDYIRGNANEWTGSLVSCGWYNLGHNIGAAEPGDVLVAPDVHYINKNNVRKKSYHVQFFADDGKWYSDFAQERLSPYSSISDSEFIGISYLFRFPNKTGGNFKYLNKNANGELIDDEGVLRDYEKEFNEDLGLRVDGWLESATNLAKKVGETAWDFTESALNLTNSSVKTIKDGDLITDELTSYQAYRQADSAGRLKYLRGSMSMSDWQRAVRDLTGKSPSELISGTKFSRSSSAKIGSSSRASSGNSYSTPYNKGEVTYKNPGDEVASRFEKSNESASDKQAAATLILAEQQERMNASLDAIKFNTATTNTNAVSSSTPTSTLAPSTTTGASSEN